MKFSTMTPFPPVREESWRSLSTVQNFAAHIFSEISISRFVSAGVDRVQTSEGSQWELCPAVQTVPPVLPANYTHININFGWSSVSSSSQHINTFPISLLIYLLPLSSLSLPLLPGWSFYAAVPSEDCESIVCQT